MVLECISLLFTCCVILLPPVSFLSGNYTKVFFFLPLRHALCPSSGKYTTSDSLSSVPPTSFAFLQSVNYWISLLSFVLSSNPIFRLQVNNPVQHYSCDLHTDICTSIKLNSLRLVMEQVAAALFFRFSFFARDSLSDV